MSIRILPNGDLVTLTSDEARAAPRQTLAISLVGRRGQHGITNLDAISTEVGAHARRLLERVATGVEATWYNQAVVAPSLLDAAHEAPAGFAGRFLERAVDSLLSHGC